MHEARRQHGSPSSNVGTSVQPLRMPKATDGTGHAVAPGPRRGREEPEAIAWGLSVPAPAWAGQLLPPSDRWHPGPALPTAMTVAEGSGRAHSLSDPTAAADLAQGCSPGERFPGRQRATGAGSRLVHSEGAGTGGRQACSARLVAVPATTRWMGGHRLPEPRAFSRFYRQLVRLPLETELSRRLVEAWAGAERKWGSVPDTPEQTDREADGEKGLEGQGAADGRQGGGARPQVPA